MLCDHKVFRQQDLNNYCDETSKNRSISERLASHKRQIIIVTHNPNLAIVCDADQIINMQIEKENKNAVKFQSGAIEDEKMNKTIINILEGTLPAFNNRKYKYKR